MIYLYAVMYAFLNPSSFNFRRSLRQLEQAELPDLVLKLLVAFAVHGRVRRAAHFGEQRVHGCVDECAVVSTERQRNRKCTQPTCRGINTLSKLALAVIHRHLSFRDIDIPLAILKVQLQEQS